MKLYRLSLIGLLALSLVALGGCKKNTEETTAPVAETTTQTTTETPTAVDPNMPQLTRAEVDAIVTDLNFTELTTDLSKLKRKSSILQKLEATKTASKHHISNIYYGLTDNKMYIYPKMELPEDYTPTSRPWYTKTMESPTTPYISEVYLDSYTNLYILTVAAPVKKDGEVKGVIGIDVVVGGDVSTLDSTSDSNSNTNSSTTTTSIPGN